MTAVSRRGFLAAVTAVAVGACEVGPVTWNLDPGSIPDAPAYPFRLGVASGDPTADGFVLWTRLAPEPTAGGGMPTVDVPVAWDLALDENFDDIVASEALYATPELAHSVHVEVSGLPADSWFFYRFRTVNYTSPVGRARTAPAPGATGPLRFAATSCQNWTQGYYAAHAHLAQEGCDLVVHLGDYIYEGGGTGPVRSHGSPTATTLAAYRNRYGLYKSDPDLQAAHAACPWLVIWDDHEVANDYAGDYFPGSTVAAFRARRAAAYQAWYEHQPVRLPPPSGPDWAIYRTCDWGDLARFHLIDSRQYRSIQTCGGGLVPDCPERTEPTRSILGADQEAWLEAQLTSSSAIWNVLANQVMFSPMPIGDGFNMDQWDGYPACRDRVWGALRDAANPVVITGDIHLGAIAALHHDLGDPSTPDVGVELVAPSISSRFTSISPSIMESFLMSLPGFSYANATQRGYAVVDLSATQLEARYRVVSTTDTPTASISTATTFQRDASPGTTG